MTTTTYRAKGGLLLTIRPLRPDDTPYLHDLFAHLSPQSRYMRFHLALEHPDPVWMEETAQHIAAIQPPSQGWLAFGDLPDEPQACIGGARFLVTRPGIAEASLTVRDDFQGQGIGTELLRLLVIAAQKAGVRTLVADAQGSNQSVFRMLRGLGLPYHSSTHAGETHLEIDLGEVSPDETRQGDHGLGPESIS